jgi:hypothetical protein
MGAAWEGYMEVRAIFSYLVHPGKHEKHQKDIKGTAIPREARVWTVMSDLFDDAERDCEIGIAFRPGESGKKDNPSRDDLIRFLRKHNLDNGLAIASRLQSVTTNKSGLGLLFLAYGKEKDSMKILLSRFPAEAGILADEEGGTLSIKYVDRVFMKNWKTYKAALYSGSSFDGDFWFGKAIDKQINERASGLSDYWVHEFLLSNLRTPGRVGTKRFAIALKEAAKHATSLEVHDELAMLSKLAMKQRGAVSVNDLLEKFELRQETRDLIRKGFKNEQLMAEKFYFDHAAYEEDLAYRTVQLDTGALMTAEVEKFDEVFHRERVREKKDTFRFTTEGQIEIQRFKKASL